MISSFIIAYLLVGFLTGVFILWVTFQPDYDDFCRDFLREEPPATKWKLITSVLALGIWPYYLIRINL